MLEVLRSGQLSLGPMPPASRRASRGAWAWRTPARSRAAPPACTSALRALGLADGDEVVTCPFSFVASANAVLFERAPPVFADIDPVTLNAPPTRRRPR